MKIIITESQLNLLKKLTLSESEIKLVNSVIDEEGVFISDEGILNELFEIESKEDLEKDVELVDVCDFKE